MKTVNALPIIPYAVEIKNVLDTETFDQLTAQIAALRAASAKCLAVHPGQIIFKISGIDAYQLITKTYHKDRCAPLEIYIEVGPRLSQALSNHKEEILKSASEEVASLSRAKVYFLPMQALSNGQFMIEEMTGKVFHPFPDIKNTRNAPKPPFIDSRIFLYEHQIVTPYLSTIIQCAMKREGTATQDLADIIQSYATWIFAGKHLSAETAEIFIDFCMNSQYKTLRQEVEKHIWFPENSTFSHMLSYIRFHPKHEDAFIEVVQKPLAAELKATQEKTAFTTLILNMSEQQLAHVHEQNKVLLNQLAALKEQKLAAEKTLHATQETLAVRLAEKVQTENLLQETQSALAATLKEKKKTETTLQETQSVLAVTSEEKKKTETILQETNAAHTVTSEALANQTSELAKEKETATTTATTHSEELRLLREELAASKKATEAEKLKNKELFVKSKKAKEEYDTSSDTKDVDILMLTNELQSLKSERIKLLRERNKLKSSTSGLEIAPAQPKQVHKKEQKKEPIKEHEKEPIKNPEKESVIETETHTAPVVIEVIEKPQTELTPVAVAKSEPPTLPVNMVEQIRKRFAWYLLRMLSADVNNPLPRYEATIPQYTEATANEIAPMEEALKLVPNVIRTAREAFDTASQLKQLFALIRVISPEEDLCENLNNLLMYADNIIDASFTAKNMDLPANERIGFFVELLQLLLHFLKLTQNNEKSIEVIQSFINKLSSKEQIDYNFQIKILAKLQRISDIHHHMVMHSSLINAACTVYGAFVRNPSVGIDPQLFEIQLDSEGFYKTLISFESVKHPDTDPYQDEFRFAKMRFIETLVLSKIDHIRPDHIDNLMIFFAKKHRFDLIMEACTPLLRKHFETLKEKPKSKHDVKIHVANTTKSTYTNILKALALTFPDSPPTRIYENYLYACARWSADRSNPPVTHEHDLIRIITFLLSEDFIKKVTLAKTKDQQRLEINNGIIQALEEFKQNNILNIPENDHKAYVVFIFENIVKGHEDTLGRSKPIYMMILDTLKAANKPTAVSSPAPTSEELRLMLATFLSSCMSRQMLSTTLLSDFPSFAEVAHDYQRLIHSPEHVQELNSPAFEKLLPRIPLAATVKNAADMANVYLHFIRSFQYMHMSIKDDDLELELSHFLIDIDNKPNEIQVDNNEDTATRLTKMRTIAISVCYFLIEWNAYQKDPNSADAGFSKTAERVLILLNDETVQKKFLVKMDRIAKLVRFLHKNDAIFIDSATLLSSVSATNNPSISFDARERNFFITLATLMHDIGVQDSTDLILAQQCLAEYIRTKCSPNFASLKGANIALALAVLDYGFSKSVTTDPLPDHVNLDAINKLSTFIQTNFQRMIKADPVAMKANIEYAYPASADPQHTRKLLAFFMIEHIQNFSKATPSIALHSFAGRFEVLEKNLSELPPDQLNAVNALSELFPETEDVEQVDNLAFLLMQPRHCFSRWNTLEDDALFDALLREFIVIDNESDTYDADDMDQESSPQRVDDLCYRFRLLASFLNHADLAQFGDFEPLRSTATRVVALLDDEKHIQTLQWKFIEVGDTHRFLFQHMQLILRARVLLDKGKPLTDDCIAFYAKCPNLLKQVLAPTTDNPDGLTKAELYLLADLKQLTGDPRFALASVTPQQWKELKGAMATAYEVSLKKPAVAPHNKPATFLPSSGGESSAMGAARANTVTNSVK